MIVNGRYEGTAQDGRTELVVRIDVDGLEGASPSVNCVSGDVFAVNRQGERTWNNYLRSWRVESPSLLSSSAPFEITGTATSSTPGESLAVHVYIPVQGGELGPAIVTLTYSDSESSVYSCPRAGDAFREVTLEVDICKSVTDHPEPQVQITNGPRITRESAYAAAGILLSFASGKQNTDSGVDDVSTSGPGLTWTDDELNHALADHFGGAKAADVGSRPQWSLWGLLAGAHTDPATAGVMFDTVSGPANALNPSRQGFAVFRNHEWFQHLSASDPMAQRRYLLAWVHEMGHAFNLRHPEDTSIERDVPTWMASELDFDNQGLTFWDRFQFQFDSKELMHLRHGFLRNVAIGGEDFETVSYLKSAPGERMLSEHEVMFSRVMTRVPIELLLRSRGYFEFREPVIIEARLRNLEREPLPIRSSLDPSERSLTLVILRPDGRLVKYEPLICRLTNSRPRELAPYGVTGPDRYSAAVPLTFGRDGFYFDTPGEYRIRAMYPFGNGVVLSNTLRVRVGHPLSREVDRRAQDFFTDDVGWALYLEGSRSPYLERGLNELRRVADEAKSTQLGIQLATSIVRGVGDPFHKVESKAVQVVKGEPDVALTLTDPAYRFFHELPTQYPKVEDQKPFNLPYARLVRRRAKYHRAINPPAATNEVAVLLKDLSGRDVHQPVLEELSSEIMKQDQEYT